MVTGVHSSKLKIKICNQFAWYNKVIGEKRSNGRSKVIFQFQEFFCMLILYVQIDKREMFKISYMVRLLKLHTSYNTSKAVTRT